MRSLSASLHYFCKKLVLVKLGQTGTPLEIYLSRFFYTLLLCSLVLCVASCSPQRETAGSRGMQNLTARFNILYNARIMVNESEQALQLAYQDNYDRLIPVYQEPDETLAQAETKKLDEVIAKANKIVNEKSQSNYVGDAYFLIAKANHLKANYFNAAEFFTYIYSSYPKEIALRQTALAWKARSLMALERFEEAEATLDTALKSITTDKTSAAGIYAADAQLRIYAKQDKEAITLLQKAITLTDNKAERIRWTYLLAQLQQLTGDHAAAFANFTKVIKSNAPFDMAFNANLSRISIESGQNGQQGSREQKLKALLKDDKSEEFTDQIYYQIGKYHEENKDLQKAVENYNASVRSSTKNMGQKGLTYLSLAELYFNQADYIRSKAYYDSTLKTLPPTYPDYDQIKTKGQNLELLAQSLTIISREDTLQALAKLPQNERKKRLALLNGAEAGQNAATKGQDGTFTTPFDDASGQAETNATKDGKFYFTNSTAISQGFSDFKRRWGNRKLEDNWRRSEKAAVALENAPLDAIDPDADPSPATQPASATPQAGTITEKDLPLTPGLLAESDQRIINAMYDVGNYYREVLTDTAEAIDAFEALLERYPENSNKLAVYYNLYRLYSTVDEQQSNKYKNLLLTQHAGSPFAKAITDPDFNQKTDSRDAALNRFYDEVYQSYALKKYDAVLNLTIKAQSEFGNTKFSAQFAYLNALAIGRTRPLPDFEKALKEIPPKFPQDKLVVPLIRQHLVYVDSNRTAMAARATALVDFDPNEPRFIDEPEVQPATVIAAKPTQSAGQKPESAASTPATVKVPETASPPEVNTSEFVALPDSAEYYYVINVMDAAVNLSSSRFGIGQFNRANFAGGGIKHQLKDISNENQLIYVGVFYSRDAVVQYALNITPLMPEIMKIPAGTYNTFIATKNTFELFNDKQTVNRYIDFYKRFTN